VVTITEKVAHPAFLEPVTTAVGPDQEEQDRRHQEQHPYLAQPGGADSQPEDVVDHPRDVVRGLEASVVVQDVQDARDVLSEDGQGEPADHDRGGRSPEQSLDRPARAQQRERQ